ncbi:PAS domain-containing protein [Leptolyngbya sp. 15MV]|nr:PAS domain-containing protein [Leptolyngbya sp. 15MV]
MKGLFAKMGGGSAAVDDLRPIGRGDKAGRLALLDTFEDSGLGWFWATDALGRLIYLSDSAAGQLGERANDVLGANLSTLFSTDTGYDGEEKSRPLAFLFSTRNAINDLPVRVTLEDRELCWSISGRPQVDANGDFHGYRGSAKDITVERERQRDAARISERECRWAGRAVQEYA